jgi:hypothetical protein
MIRNDLIIRGRGVKVPHTEVAVTQEDIDQALRKDSSRCVVATAIARVFPKASRIVVDVHSIKFTDGPRRYTYLTPPKVMDYIVAFDAGDQLHPFRFRLRSDQRLVQQRARKTPAGKEIHNADMRARSRKARLEEHAADPAATPAQVEIATDRYAESLAEVEQARAAAGATIPAGQTKRRYTTPVTPVEDVSDLPPEEVRPVPSGRSTVFYRNLRVYGQRVMRVNQHGDTAGDYRVPLDDDE